GEGARVVRGGSWFGGPKKCRAAHRGWYAPGVRNDDVGCRVVLCPDLVTLRPRPRHPLPPSEAKQAGERGERRPTQGRRRSAGNCRMRSRVASFTLPNVRLTLAWRSVYTLPTRTRVGWFNVPEAR